jgi:CheY-like chemotaxis protein
MLLTLQLEDLGCKVIEAGSAIAALRVVREYGPPNIAIIDVAMPELSGFELVLILRGRSDTADLPVVFLSGRVHPSDIETGRSLGASYVTKPFEPDELLRAMEAEVEARALRA